MFSNNETLPDLPVIKARSFYLMLLALAITAANFYGIDLLGVFAAMGIGSTQGEIIATGERAVSAWQIVAPMVAGIWAYLERKAPNFRLVWPWSKRTGGKA